MESKLNNKFNPKSILATKTAAATSNSSRNSTIVSSLASVNVNVNGKERSGQTNGHVRSKLSFVGGSKNCKNNTDDGCDVNNEEVDDDEVDYDEDEDGDEDEDDEFVEHLIFHPSPYTSVSNRTSGSVGGGGGVNSIIGSSKNDNSNDTIDDEDDVNNLLERAARVRREFASGSSNSSLNSNDTITSNLRNVRPVASAASPAVGKESNDFLAPLHGSNSNLNLRSNYARLKAASLDSSSSTSNSRVDRQTGNNGTTVYHPLRRLSAINSNGMSNDQSRNNNSNITSGISGFGCNSIDSSSPSHLSHLTSSSVASSTGSNDHSITPTRNARCSVNSNSYTLPNNYANRRLSSPVSPVCSFFSEEGGGSSSTDCYFDATPSFKSPSPPPPTTGTGTTTTTTTASTIQPSSLAESSSANPPSAPGRKRSLISTATPGASASSTPSSISQSKHLSKTGHDTWLGKQTQSGTGSSFTEEYCLCGYFIFISMQPSYPSTSLLELPMSCSNQL